MCALLSDRDDDRMPARCDGKQANAVLSNPPNKRANRAN